MARDKLSAREAALIAQARAELQKKSGVPARAPAAHPAAPPAAKPAAPAAAKTVAPAASLDPAERAAALIAAARAETAQRRRQLRRIYVWAPAAIMFVAGLWTLLWMWHRL